MDKPTIYTAEIDRDGEAVITFLRPEDIWGPIKFYIEPGIVIDSGEVYQRWRKGGKEVEASFYLPSDSLIDPFSWRAVSLRPDEERPIASGVCPGSE